MTPWFQESEESVKLESGLFSLPERAQINSGAECLISHEKAP